MKAFFGEGGDFFFLFVCLFYCTSCLSVLGTCLTKTSVLEAQNDGVL